MSAIGKILFVDESGDVHDLTPYTGATAWSAEGARVGIVTCRRCGAAILLDPRDADDPISIHSAWHEAHDG